MVVATIDGQAVSWVNEYAGPGAESNTAAAPLARRKSSDLEIVSTGTEEKRLRFRAGLTMEGVERIEKRNGDGGVLLLLYGNMERLAGLRTIQ